LTFLVIIGLCTVVNEYVTQGPGIVIPTVNAAKQGFSGVRDFISNLTGAQVKKPSTRDPPTLDRPTPDKPRPKTPNPTSRESYVRKYTPLAERHGKNTTTKESGWFAKLQAEFPRKTSTKGSTDQTSDDMTTTATSGNPVKTSKLWYERIPFNIPFVPTGDKLIRTAMKDATINPEEPVKLVDSDKPVDPPTGFPDGGADENPVKKQVLWYERLPLNIPFVPAIDSLVRKAVTNSEKPIVPAESSKSADPPTGFLDERADDIFTRMINVGFSLGDPTLLPYPPLTDLTSKLRIAHEVFYRGQQTYKKRNATLSDLNLQSKVAFGEIEKSLSNVDFINGIQGSEHFASISKRLLETMRNFEKKGQLGKEVQRALWLRYQQELKTYYSRAEDWVKRIARVHRHVKRLGEAVEEATPVLMANLNAEAEMQKKEDRMAWAAEAGNRFEAQEQLLNGIKSQGVIVDSALLEAIEKLKKVMEHKEVDVKNFATVKDEGVVKDIAEQIDIVILLQQETEKSLRLAKDARKNMTTGGRRFKAGEHPEL